LKSQAIPFLDKAKSPYKAAKLAKTLEPSNPYVQEAIYYCLACDGHIDQVLIAFDVLFKMINVNVAW
jgi:hypothetical protein